MTGSQAAGWRWEALIWSGNFPEWSPVLAPGVNHLKGALWLGLLWWSWSVGMAVVPRILQHTFRNVCVRLARTLQLWKPVETRPDLGGLLLLNIIYSEVVLRLGYFTKYDRGVAFSLPFFRKTNKLCDGENSISLMRYRNASFLFRNNAGTPGKHHKAEEHPRARTKSVPRYSSLVSLSQRGMKWPHSRRRKKPDSTSHSASLSKLPDLYKFERVRAKRSDPALNPYIYLLFFKRTMRELYELVVISFTKPLALREQK